MKKLTKETIFGICAAIAGIIFIALIIYFCSCSETFKDMVKGKPKQGEKWLEDVKKKWMKAKKQKTPKSTDMEDQKEWDKLVEKYSKLAKARH